MTIEIIHHYPPEILNLLVDTIPLLCRSKTTSWCSSRVREYREQLRRIFRQKLATGRGSLNKHEIVWKVLIRLNDKCEASLRERREVLKRVIEFEDFSTCWPNDQLKAKGLVAEIRRVVDVKDSFGRMRLEQEAERKKRLEEENRKRAIQNERKANLEQVKKDLYALFGTADPQKRGKQEGFPVPLDLLTAGKNHRE